MLNIYLARHGQDQDNANRILNGRRDTPLTETGINQAMQLAEKIKSSGIVFKKAFTSPLKRTFQTAKIITDILGMENPEKLDLLIERDFGVMTGEPLEKIKEKCAPDILETENITYFLCPGGAETFPLLMERANKLLSWLKENVKDGNVLLVSHGDIGKMIYAEYYHLDWQEVLRMFHFGNSDLLLLSPDSPANEPYVFTAAQNKKQMILLSKEQEERLNKVIDKFPQVKEIAGKFNEGEVKWAIAAGTATYIYCGGDESLLDDIDIWIASESKEKVSEILGQKWQPQSSERHKAENIAFGSFDIFINCRKFREEEQLLDYQWTKSSEDHLREKAIDGVIYKIVSPEDVVVLKKPNAREKDKADIASIEKIGLDDTYLKERFIECNLAKTDKVKVN